MGSGFARSSLLRVSHGYQAVLTLAPFAPSEHPRHQELNEANAVLRSLLGVQRISDNSLFSLRTKTSGTALFLEEETTRLHATMLLLHLLSGRQSHTGASNSSAATAVPRPIKLYRYNAIELHFRTPKMQTAEITHKHSVWGPPKLIEGEQERYMGSLLVAGDLVDYLADLEVHVEKIDNK